MLPEDKLQEVVQSSLLHSVLWCLLPSDEDTIVDTLLIPLLLDLFLARCRRAYQRQVLQARARLKTLADTYRVGTN